MYDLHSHILPGVDDGAETMDHSVRMARVAADNGTKTVVATPHRKDVTEGFSVGHLHELVAQFKTQLASEKVGLHVPNCELSAGRSQYRPAGGNRVRLPLPAVQTNRPTKEGAYSYMMVAVLSFAK